MNVQIACAKFKGADTVAVQQARSRRPWWKFWRA